MHPVQKHLMDTAFAGLEGTELEGTIALSDELINLGLLEVIAKLKSAAAAPAVTPDDSPAPTPPATDAPFDPQVLLKKLNVEKLHYRTERGKSLLDIKAGFGA